MNKYQKEKSREIRDIMRTDSWRRMSYKEAKRKWRKGIRAFRIGDMYAWEAFDASRLGFSRKQLQDVGKEYHKILTYCGERNLRLHCEYNRRIDFYELRFYGRSVDGKTFGIGYSIDGFKVRLYAGALSDITNRMLEEVNRRLQEFIFPSVIKTDLNVESLYPRMTLYPWDCRIVENVFSKIVVKE